jgi:hypothetical protein
MKRSGIDSIRKIKTTGVLSIAVLTAATMMLLCEMESPTQQEVPEHNELYEHSYMHEPAQYAMSEQNLPENYPVDPEFSDLRTFVGGDFKLALALGSELYLISSENGNTSSYLVTQGDESGIPGRDTRIWSPLFSADGRHITFESWASNIRVFVRPTNPDSALRLCILNPYGPIATDPHFRDANGKRYITFTDTRTIKYLEESGRLSGTTYQVSYWEDSVGIVEKMDIPGAFNGGFSRDGKWVCAGLTTSALYNLAENAGPTILGGGEQHCNPSINPFTSGPHTDYMMLLTFGLDEESGIRAVDGTPVVEKQHENVWVFNSRNNVVWKCPRPDLVSGADSSIYDAVERPEWSTHPEYATFIAQYPGEAYIGDLYVVRINALETGTEQSLIQPGPGDVLKVAEKIPTTTTTHLWVGGL